MGEQGGHLQWYDATRLVDNELRRHGRRTSRQLVDAFRAAGGVGSSRAFLQTQLIAATGGSHPFGYDGEWVSSELSRSVRMARRLVIKTKPERVLNVVLRRDIPMSPEREWAIRLTAELNQGALSGREQGDALRFIAESDSQEQLDELIYNASRKPRLTLRGQVCLDVLDACDPAVVLPFESN